MSDVRWPVFPSRPDVVNWWARVQPARTALVDRRADRRLTYSELDSESEAWAGLLRSAGAVAGDRIAVLSGNRSELMALFGACLRTGAVLLPLNWRLAAPELANVLLDSTPRLLIGEGRFRGVAEAADRLNGTNARWIDIDDDAPRLLAKSRGSRSDHVRAEPNAPTMILYTSGSTGKPKGVVLPHRQLFYNALATTMSWELGATDIGPVGTPCFHTGGWHVLTAPLFHVGGTVVLFDQFDPTAFLEGLAEERCTIAFSVPTQITMLMESPAWGRPLPSLRFLISGGAPCPEPLMERVRNAGIRFRQGFGLTEFGPNCFAISDEDALRKTNSVGRPVHFLEMRLASGDGREADVGEPGELLLRGPQMFSGYWNAPERTADVVDADGWLHTGDLATRDADGAYRICGRKKEMYISGGENVFPGEVEAALSSCPGVGEVVVIGIPDARWGEVGRAFVVARQGEHVTEHRVVSHARERLAGYKVPKSVVVLPEIPRLGSGKPDRGALARLPFERDALVT